MQPKRILSVNPVAVGMGSYSNADTGKGALIMHILAAILIPVALIFICLIGAFIG